MLAIFSTCMYSGGYFGALRQWPCYYLLFGGWNKSKVDDCGYSGFGFRFLELY